VVRVVDIVIDLPLKNIIKKFCDKEFRLLHTVQFTSIFQGGIVKLLSNTTYIMKQGQRCFTRMSSTVGWLGLSSMDTL